MLTLLAVGGTAAAAHAFAEAFYEGVTAAEAIEWRTGRPTPRPGALVRSIPHLTLIAVNALMAAGTAVGLALVLLPGVVFGTYTALAPALVEIEHRGVWASLRRSAQLVRGSFWRVLLILWWAYLVTLVAGGLLELALDHVVAEYLASTVVESPLAPFYGLAAVLVAFELIERERGE